MITKSNKSIFAPSIALVASLASSIPLAAQSSYSLGMENDTGYNIYQVRMSSVHDPSWGATSWDPGSSGTELRLPSLRSRLDTTI